MMRHTRALENLDQEMREHIDRETRENIERGMPPEDARYAALRKFGNVTLAIEDARAVWTPIWIEQLRQDAHYAIRMLRRNPGFTVTVVLTLALGIGMNTAVFSVVNAVLLRPLSYPNPERLVWLATDDTLSHEEIVPRYDFWAWRDQGRSFERMVGYRSEDDTIATIDTAVQARVAWVSDDFWDVTRPNVAFGRLPSPGEHDALLLSYRLFERDFHRDAAIVGRAAALNGRQITVVGILVPDFRFQLVPPPRRGPDSHEIEAYVLLEAAPQDTARSRGRTVSVVAKLKSDTTLDQARAELEVIRARIAQQHPSAYLDRMPLRMLALQERLVGQARLPLWVLLTAVGFVLLIACANVASLLLARASARHKEIAIRASLGAGRARVLRQFLTESLLLVTFGCAAGLIVSRWALANLPRLVPDAVPRLAETTLDGRVLAFALGASIITVCIFGLAPARAIWRTDLVDAMRDGARTASATPGSLMARRVLVAVELALAVVLLSGAGLMIKSFWRMNAHPPGYHPESILVLKVPLSGPAYDDPRRRHAYSAEVLRRVQSIPGVLVAGITPHYQIRTSLSLEGVPPSDRLKASTALNATSAGYAAAMGLQLMRGRWITDSELTPAVVVNESFARREYADQDPLGRRIWMQALTDPRTPTYAPIVGVVANLKDSRLDAEPEPELYVPYAQVPIGSGVTVVVRTAGDPLVAAPVLRSVVADLDKTQAVYDVKTLEQALAESVGSRRFTLFLLGIFAAAALLLALVGIYGVIAYSVAQRTREVGVRLALGAQRAEIVRMVVRQGMQLAVCGIVVGLAAAAGLTRLMAGLLYEVAPSDPQTFGLVAALLLAAALVACFGPAARAARLDPIIALRED